MPRGPCSELGVPPKGRGTHLPPGGLAPACLPAPLLCPHPGEPWRWPLAPTAPLHPSCLQNHVNLVHRKGKTKVCPHPGCGKKFYLSNHLRRHMIIHSGQARGGAGSTGHGVLGLRFRVGSGVPRHRTATHGVGCGLSGEPCCLCPVGGRGFRFFERQELWICM